MKNGDLGVIQPFDPAQTTLYWFGDSIPSSGGASAPSFVDMLADPLLFPQWAAHQSINAAVGGHVFAQQEAIYSANWDAQLQSEAASGRTVIVTYAIGGNDMNSKTPAALLAELTAHSAYLRSHNIKTVCATVMPRSYAQGTEFEQFNEMLIRSSGLFDWVVDFVLADDPFEVSLYYDGTHPTAALHHELARAWDIGIRLGLHPTNRRRYVRTTSSMDAGLKISGKSGGQTAHLQDWDIGGGSPASYVDGLGNFYVRSINLINTTSGISWPAGGTVGPLAAMALAGTGVFFDNVSAMIVFKASASEQWSILNTGDLVPLSQNNIGSATAPVQNIFAESITIGGSNLAQMISDLQARINALEQPQMMKAKPPANPTNRR